MTSFPGNGTFPWSFASLDGDDADFDRAAAAILPVPYDGTVSYRSGARDGPQAIIEASRYLELYEPDLDLEPSQWGIATLPALEPYASGPEANIAHVEQTIGTLADAGKLPVMLGGEHSLTIGAVRALALVDYGLNDEDVPPFDNTTCPLVLIRGRQSEIADHQQVVSARSALGAKCKLVELENCGSRAAESCPQDFVATVEWFLRAESD